MNEYIKINEQIINPKELITISDSIKWGDIRAYEIVLNSSYDHIKELFHDDIEWSIIREFEIAQFGPNNEPIAPITKEEEEDCSTLVVTDRYTDYCDGTVSVIMREQTALEEAYELLYGGE